MATTNRRHRPQRDPEKVALEEFASLCQDLRQVIDDRKGWHENGHSRDCKSPHCNEDPLYHEILRLNGEIAVKKVEYLRAVARDCDKGEEGYKPSQHDRCSHQRVALATLEKIEDVYGLRKGRGKAT